MNRLLRVLATLCFSGFGANAAITTTFEAAGAEHTTQTGIIEETFELKSTGVFSGATAIGQFSAGGELIKNSDVYGSSDKYLTMGLYATGTVTGAAPQTYTVTFDSAVNYFGFYWAAVDGDDKVEIFNGSDLLGTYTSALFASLPASYLKANGTEAPPAPRTQEYYAFVNFFGTGTTTFTKAIFTNGGSGTGFETDNYTISDGTTGPFADVPEPATFGLVGLSLALLAYGFRKRSHA